MKRMEVLCICLKAVMFSVSGVHGWGGVLGPPPLWVMSVRYEQYIYAEYAVCVGHQVPGGAPSQLLKKKKWRAIPVPTTTHTTH